MVAKVFIELHPFAKIVLLDSANTVGGVWSKERLYPGLKSNNMLGTYEYPDFPMDAETFGVKPGQFIPGEVLHRYLSMFAQKYNITEKIRFNTKVETAEKQGIEGWLLQLSTNGTSNSLLTEKLVLATGNTSNPFVPYIEGSDSFNAPLFHVKDLQRQIPTMHSAKEVVVLGGTKSAWDSAYAFAVAEGNATVHMVIRESGHGPIWMAPPYVTPLKKWLEKLVHTRFLTWFSPCIWGAYDDYAAVRNFFHGNAVGRKIVDTFWGILGGDVLTLNGYDKHPETAKLKPWSNPMFIGSGLSILNYDQDFFQLVRDGKIKVHIADIKNLSDHTVHLSSGETINADALVCSTGWKHHPPIKFLPNEDAAYGLPHYTDATSELTQQADKEILSTFPRLKNQPVQNPKMTAPLTEKSDEMAPTKMNAPYNLYKFMVPPALIDDRSLGFAGVPMHISTSTVATVQAIWLSAYFDGQMPIPSHDAVDYESALHSRFGKWRYPAGHGAQYPDFVFDAVPYIDMLLKQLGLQNHRKTGTMNDIFQPYGPEDYKGLVDEFREEHGIKVA